MKRDWQDKLLWFDMNDKKSCELERRGTFPVKSCLELLGNNERRFFAWKQLGETLD